MSQGRAFYEKNMTEQIGDRFQEETKYSPWSLKGHTLDWSRKPEPIKVYKDPIDMVPLPAVNPEDYPMPLVEALFKRRSKRVYLKEAILPLKDLAFLLWATQGVTARYGSQVLFRTAPSAGALYPVETYVHARSVEGLRQGIYHYRVDNFSLEFIREGDFSEELALAALGQAMVQKAQVVFLWTAVPERSRWKYRQRAWRYIYLDAGHICQNLYLAAEAADLGCCGIGAFFDDWVNSIIGVDPKEETIVYMATVGRPKTQEREV
ncbi:MAG: SagB/ThcOx family dehydrogenase [Nitrospirae bacterium]|nr:MAG: SagB/ThcOx family dehydrogenase [Nitrospirota bacterium]